MNSLVVSESCFLGEYPLTVPITLYRDGEMIFAEAPDGQTYAVNGTAALTHQRIDPFWKRVPGSKYMRVNIGPLIDLGLSLGATT